MSKHFSLMVAAAHLCSQTNVCIENEKRKLTLGVYYLRKRGVSQHAAYLQNSWTDEPQKRKISLLPEEPRDFLVKQTCFFIFVLVYSLVHIYKF